MNTAIGRRELLSREEELALARLISESRVRLWRALLSHPPAVRHFRERIDEVDDTAACLDDPDAAALRLCETDVNGDLRRSLVASVLGLSRSGRKRAGDLRISTRTFSRYADRVAGAHGALDAEMHEFAESNLRLVYSVAKRFAGSGVSMDDLFQEGTLGLVRAVERFDYTRGFRFSTFATYWIRHFILRSIANRSRTVRVPVNVTEKFQRVKRAEGDLLSELGRRPTEAEVAKKVGVAISRLRSIVSSATAEEVSLDHGRSTDDRSLSESLADPEQPNVADSVIDRLALEEIERRVNDLTPIEADVIRRRFALGHDRSHTLAEIGRRRDLSRERVRQIQRQALRKLRGSLSA